MCSNLPILGFLGLYLLEFGRGTPQTDGRTDIAYHALILSLASETRCDDAVFLSGQFAGARSTTESSMPCTLQHHRSFWCATCTTKATTPVHTPQAILSLHLTCAAHRLYIVEIVAHFVHFPGGLTKKSQRKFLRVFSIPWGHPVPVGVTSYTFL